MFYTKPTDLNFSPENFYKEPVAPSNPSSLSDIYSTAKTEEHTNQQLLSSHWNLADVYDEHNKKVKALTGADLINPTTLYSPSDGRDEERKRYYADFAKYKEEGGSLNQLGFLKNWREQDYRRQLEELAAKHPDKRGELLPERSFIDQSFGKRGETEKKAETTWEHSGKGMLDWGAWLSGKVAAGLTDPINVITAPVGFGAVGTGAKGLAMGFIKNGGVNAMVEVGQQPFIQGQRSDAGQSHGIAQGAENVAGAFLFGGALDTAVRGTARALRYSFGYEPVVHDGVVVGYRRKTDAPAGGEVAPVPEISPDLIERAGRNDRAAMDEIERILSKDKSYIPAETVAKADAGDARAIRDVAERTGLADDPAMRHALDAMDANERIAEPPTKTIAKGDHDAAITQGMRHAADPELEPMPVVRENVSPSRIHDMQGDILDLQAEIRRIGDELAADPNAHPPTVLADMRMKMAEVVEAHDAARRQVFADDVIEMVDAGKAPQDLADIVANHVDDKSLQGKLLTDLIARKPESPLEARNQIAELLASPDYKPQPLDTDVAPVGLKTRALDDPYGPDAVKQTQALEASMAEELGRKTAPPPTPEEVGAKIKEVIDRGEQVRAAIAEVSGIVPAGVEVKVFSSVADLPDAIRGQVEMANAKAFAVAMQRFQSATSEVAREAARRMKDDAKMGRGIEGIAQDGTIWIASFAMDPKGRVAHEVVHALRTMGQIAPDEVRVLAAYARETGAFDGAKEKLYRTELEGRGFDEAKVAALLDEEAAAHAIEGAARRTDTPTPVKSITDRIYEFIERVGNALRRQGFMTAEEKTTLAAKPANDVIQSFMSGEMMKREGVKAWMRQEDLTAYAMRDGLDMSPEARKQRAEDMGFDTSRTWYRGAASDRPELKAIESEVKFPAVWFSANPNRASEFAFLRANMKNNMNLYKDVESARPSVLPAFARGKFKTFEYLFRTANYEKMAKQLKQVKDDGYDGAIFRRINDTPGATGLSVRGAHEVLAVFDPSNIRSVNAEFDPAKADSPNLMFAFAGERAKTADLDALNRAKAMASQGIDRTEIWNGTGWFQGVDGKWRFEIDDSGLKTSLGSDEKAIRHPELEAAYPNNFYDIVGDVRRALMPSGSYINGGGGPNVHGRKIVEAYGPTESSRNTSAAHELQHFAQDMERFAPGASADAFANHVAIPGTDFSVVSNPLEARRAYRSTAGEVEARAVEFRMNLTPEQRRARPPWLDYDVPEEQQIVRGMSEPMFAMVDTNVGREMKRDLDKLGYFSGALEAAKRLKQAKGTPEQMLAMLQKEGAKKAEIEATGLPKFLEGRPSVTRDEIVSHLEGNRLGLNEVVRGDSGVALEFKRLDDELNSQRRSPTQNANRISEIEQRMRELRNMDEQPNETRWATHSLDPSNPSYRETVLHLPGTEAAYEARVQAARQRYGDLEREVRGRQDMGVGYDGSELQVAAAEMTRLMQERRDFRSGHFPEPNIVGHMMTSMTKHEGKPVYTIDQIQSDWGQKLRDHGGPLDHAKIERLKQEALDAEALRDKADAERTAYRKLQSTPESASILKEFKATIDKHDTDVRRLRAELTQAQTSAPGHPLVNTTDQWTNTTLRRAIRQAAEADAEYIAIPSGDTVLSYNPGDTAGMHGFYGRTAARHEVSIGDNLEAKPGEVSRAPMEGIVPKNLRKLLTGIDKESPKPIIVKQLETPTSGMKGLGFTLFPLTEKVKQSVKEDGLPLFAMRSEPEVRAPDQPDLTPERISQLVQPYLDAYPNITRMVTDNAATVDLPSLVTRLMEDAPALAEARTALSSVVGDEAAQGIELAVLRALVTGESPVDLDALSGIARQVMDQFAPQQPRASEPMFAMGGLDMSPEARKARAEAMGFDTSAEWFHAGSVRDEFKPFAHFGTAKSAADRIAYDGEPDGKSTLRAWVRTNSPVEVADNGLGHEVAIAAALREQGHIASDDLRAVTAAWYDGLTSQQRDRIDASSAQPIESIDDVMREIENGNYAAVTNAGDLRNRPIGDMTNAAVELKRILDQAGIDAITYRNDVEDAGSMSIIVVDPKNIRSTNAAFDPAEAGSSNIMFAMRDEEGRMKLGARERAQQLQDDLAAIEAQFQVAGGDERLKLQAKRAALLNAQAFEKVIDDTGLYRDGLGRGDRARALMALIETHGENEMVPFADLVSSKKIIENHALGMIEGFLWGNRKGAILGDLRRKFNSSVKANMEDVIREASGVDTGNMTAKVFANAWIAATEYLRQRFNAAGGDIGKLVGWFMPQFHDADALVKVGREAWVNRLMTDGVLAREKIIDYETNAPMTDAKLRSMLREIWLAITSDGASRMEIGDAPAGKGALYKRHMEHRVLHFKDADQWMKYNRDFGGGDIYSAMIGHVNMMARDIALMERFGPNPERTMQRVKATILNEAKMQQPAKSMFDDFKEQIEALKASLKTLPSEVDTITAAIGDVHAKIDAIRVKNPGKRARRRAEGKIEELRQQLGPLHQRLDKAVETNNPTPQQRVMIDKIQAAAEEMAFAEQYLVTSRNPTERTNRILARADEMMKVYNGTTNTPIDSKFAGAMVGIRNTISASSLVYAPFSAVTDQATQLAARSFIGMPATSQLSSFVKGFTQGDRRLALEVGLGLDQVAAAFAQQARFVGGYNARHITGYITDRSHAYSLLSPMTQASKVGFGLDFMRWMAGMKDTAFKDLGEETTRMMTKHGFTADDWAAIKAAKPEKGMLTRNAVAQAAGEDVAEKYMRMLYRERGQAVLEGTIQGRTAWISDTQPGTVTGEALRSMAMLKSFPTSYMMLILGRLYNETMAGRGLKASTIGYGASIFIVGTMLGALAKQLKNIGQGRDPEDMTKAKFWAESFMQSGGAGIFGDFIASSVNRMGNGLAGTIMGPVADRGGTLLDLTFGNVAQYAKDEKTNAGRESVKMIRGMTPGMFAPWYIRLAYERLLLDELQKKVDPEYYKSFESKVRAQKKRSGNDFYWGPGQTSVPRGPNMGAAFGQ